MLRSLLLHGVLLVGVNTQSAACGAATPYCRNKAGADPSQYLDCAAFRTSTYSYEGCNVNSPFLCGSAQNDPSACVGLDCRLRAGGTAHFGWTLFCDNSPYCAASVDAHSTALPSLTTLCNSDWPGLAPPGLATRPPHSATARKDPHLHLAHGGRADFRGENSAIFNLLSARNFSLNAQFFDEDLRQPRKGHPQSEQLTHGTVMKRAFWNVRTPSGLVHISFNVTSPAATVMRDDQSSITVRPGHSLRVDQVNVTVSARQCQVTMDKAWDVVAKVTTPPYAALNPGKLLIDFTLTPLHDEVAGVGWVAPQ